MQVSLSFNFLLLKYYVSVFKIIPLLVFGFIRIGNSLLTLK